MHELITRNAYKIVDSLKPGGILVIEGFHRDLKQESVQGEYFGFGSNELLRVFDRLWVLYYEDATTDAEWARGAPKAPIVRFLAKKE